MMLLSVIFPAYNESRRIGAAMQQAVEYFSAWPEDVEIIIVENGSDDNTYAAAGLAFLNAVDNCGRNANNISYVAYQSAPGKGAAIRYGIQRAQGQYILITDVDLSTPLTYTKKLLSVGADLAIGSRRAKGSEVEGLRLQRKITSWVFSMMARPLISGIKDSQCGFKLLTANAARAIEKKLTLDGFAFDVEMIRIAMANGFKVSEVPVYWKHDNSSTVKVFTDSALMAFELAIIMINDATGKYII